MCSIADCGVVKVVQDGAHVTQSNYIVNTGENC